MPVPVPARADVVIVGGGHNALVAATYLGRAGLDVVVLERSDRTGGAAVSVAPWPGVSARLSRYSYLVSLMPSTLIADLGLDLELRSRPTASYSPVEVDGRPTGLHVESVPGAATAASFAEVTGSDRAYAAWTRFYDEVGALARAVAPTLLDPLPAASDLRDRAGAAIWDAVVERPLGEVIEQRFDHDLVRGVVATDALIGTFADLHDPTLVQNRCFLYHLIGNGDGEWRVPVGGMGAVTDALLRAALDAGVTICTSAEATTLDLGDDGVAVGVRSLEGDAVIDATWALGGAAPAVLDRLRGRPSTPPRGAQLKINLLVERLPRLRSGHDPHEAFAGTFHVGESWSELATAYAEAARGELPTTMPGELYCHTLTDRSILGDDLAGSAAQTLTYFGLHTPPEVFDGDHDAQRDLAVQRAIAGIDAHLDEPLGSLLVRDADGAPCLEAKTPHDIEDALAMPGGHIFHGDLAWPWLDAPCTSADTTAGDAPHSASDDASGSPAARWGVATDHRRLLLCGSGARRGGAVSGIAGHNAAMALLETVRGA